MKKIYSKLFVLALTLNFATPAIAQKNQNTAPNKKTTSPKTAVVEPACRLLWQDDSDSTIHWADLRRDNQGWTLNRQSIEAFPALDREKQKLVQMEHASGLIVVGVRDDEEGLFQSGWIALDSGVVEEEHGDHSHWRYKSPTKVIAQALDAEQGNPAHVYQYSGDIYIANDKKNGLTWIPTAAMLREPNSKHARFHSAGGGHITLAAVNGKVAYATWPDREGENAGRIDVIELGSTGSAKNYQLRLPLGGLHGATTNSQRVFFAPSDGIYWINADVNLNQNQQATEYHRLDLGTEPVTNKAYRTGAFANHAQFVLFASGSSDNSFLGIIDAKSATPSVQKVSIPTSAGRALTTPQCVVTKSNKQYAFLFSDRKGSDEKETLHVVDLDPNNDGKFSDAKVCKTMDVGESKIEGHGGHHSVCFSPNRRLAFISNPGEGSIWIMTLSDLEVNAKISVGGTPSKVIAIGE